MSDPKGIGETAILRQLRSSLKKGDILVADSYYCNYWLIAMCLSIGVYVVVKNYHLRDDDPVGAKRSSKTERTVSGYVHGRPGWMSTVTDSPGIVAALPPQRPTSSRPSLR